MLPLIYSIMKLYLAISALIIKNIGPMTFVYIRCDRILLGLEMKVQYVTGGKRL
jgi:hypothetical protein